MATVKSYFAEKLRFEIDPWGVEQLIGDGARGYFLLDVRDRDAYAKGHVPGAFNAPIDSLHASMGRIPKGSTIIVYCYNVACFRAARAALELAESGFPKVVEMVGGFDEWKMHGYKVEKGRRRDGRVRDDGAQRLNSIRQLSNRLEH
jgi:rhodanese-related sulfurtransferase